MPTAYDRRPLGALRVFEAVATHLNFAAAADALNVTSAAVSQQIKALEGYIQVPLFREWIFAAAGDFPGPSSPDRRPPP